MKPLKEIQRDEMAEVVFLGVMVPELARFLDEHGWVAQPWPSGNESATSDPTYHSFIITPRQIESIDGVTDEQAREYAEAYVEALETGIGADEHVESL